MVHLDQPSAQFGTHGQGSPMCSPTFVPPNSVASWPPCPALLAFFPDACRARHIASDRCPT
eukprot:8033597-Alexandrium_andersonii.AAC.1